MKPIAEDSDNDNYTRKVAVNILTKLIDMGINIDTSDINGHTPLIYAINTATSSDNNKTEPTKSNTLPLELNKMGIDSSFNGRKQLAATLGMNNYTGQNDEELINKIQEYQNNNKSKSSKSFISFCWY